jgi:hypothetical protein
MSEHQNPHGVIVAQPEDEEAIYEQIKLLHKENGMWPLSERKVWETIRAATRGEGTTKKIIGLIKGSDGKIEGSICLTFSDCYYSDWWHWVEQWLYVGEPYRRSPHAKRLVQFAKWCSDMMSNELAGKEGGQPEVPLIVGILTMDRLEPKMRLYQRAGLQQCGAWFMHRGIPDGVRNQRHLNNGR